MSLARREILKATLIGLLVACAILGAFVLAAVLLKGEYTIDTDKFDADVEWGESVSLEGIEIIDNRTLGFLSMPLTRDKIVSIDDTEEAGRKKIVFVHNNREFTVYFDVKYKVEFLSYGEIIDTQRVFGKDELVPPVATPKTGYEFSHWDVDLSQELTGSIQVNAVFKEIDYPSLQGITATYGDTLGDVTLPSNEYGQWEFIYPSDTPVGDAGKQSFSVRFAFYEDDTYFKYGFVNIAVAQKQLEFTDVKDIFTYDGNEHFPTYSISEDVDVMVITSGSANTEAGVYEYSFEIVDRNYSGVYTGTYEIQKPTVTVKVSSATVTYPAAVPTFTYEVEGFENVELLGIKIDAPAFASQAGEFKIGITFTNNNVNYDIHNGTLTVLKGDLPVPAPEISVATFEDKLSDISFVGKYLGTWAWENPDRIIDSMDKVTAYAIFTHDDPNLNPVKMAIEITGIQKKTLSFNITGSTFTYEPGVERALIYNIVGGTNPDFDYNSIKVEGNYIPDSPAINAGTYRRTLVINDYRYEGSTTVELKILPATPATDFTKVYERVWNEDLLLSSIELPEGYAWKNPGERISGAGEHSFAVIFTPTDTSNYVTVDGQITVKVAKAKVEVVGVLGEYTKTYDTLEYNIKNSGIYARYTNGALTIKYYKDGVEVDKIVNAGTYKLVITVAEGDNYLGTTIERAVTVERAENTQTVKSEQTATYLDSLGVLRLPLDNEGSWSWLETAIGNAGTKTFTAVYTPDENANYLPRTVSVKVTVLKKTVKAPSYTATLLYNGQIQKPAIPENDSIYTILDAGGIVNGTYSATLTLVDPENYAWESSELSSIALQYTIVSVENSWVVNPSISGWTYGDEPSKPNAQAKYGDYTVEYYTAQDVKVDGVPTNAGTYYARFTSEDENCSTVTADVKFVIAKRTVTAVPKLSASTFVYTGSNQKPDVIGADLTLYSVTNNGGTNVGSYNVTLKLEDSANYKWSDVSGDTKNLTYSITKANAVISGLTINGWTYGATASVPTASTTFGNLTYVYSTAADGEYTGAVPTSAGTYYVKAVVANSSNYNGASSEPVSFTIAKASASVTGLNATYTHTYDGNAYVVSGIGKTHGESNLVLKVNGEVVNTISVTNAGTYTVEVILPESANYLEATATATITVKKAETPDVVTTTQSATYLDKLSTLTLPTSTIGTWTWKNADENTTVGNAGTNTFIAVFTPSSENAKNYNAKEVEVTVNVAKKAIDVPTAGDKTYNNTNLKSGLTNTDDYTVKTDLGGTTVGTYYVTLTLTDFANHIWKGSDGTSVDTEISFKIVKATNVWQTEPSIADWTYNETASTPSAKLTYGDYLVEYKKLGADDSTYTTTVPTLAGDYVARFSGKDTVNCDPISKTVEFTIEKADAEIDGIKNASDYVFEFDFADVDVTGGIGVSHNETSTITFTYTRDGISATKIYEPGTYTVTVNATESANYKSAVATFTVEVSKIANRDTVGDNILNQQATYGQSKSVIKLPTNTDNTGVWKVVEDVQTVGNAGKNTFTLKFTPKNPNYYSERTETITVDVAKQTVTVPTIADKVYTGSHVPSGLTTDTKYKVSEGSSNVKVDTYEVELELLDSNNYVWSNGATLTTKVTYNVIKAENTDDLGPYPATYGDLLSSVKLPATAEGTWTWEGLTAEMTVGNAGERFFTAVYTCTTGNYNDRRVTVKINVDRKALTTTPELAKNSFTYGENRDFGIDTNEYYTVTDNGNGIVGDHTVTVSLKPNYKWSDGTTADLTLSYEVIQADNTDEVDTVQEATYGDMFSSLTLPDASEKGSWSWKNIGSPETTPVGNFGEHTYTALFTPANSNYKSKEVEVTIIVSKKLVNVPELRIDEFTYVKGLVQAPTVVDNDATNKSYYSISFENENSTNAGTYKVTLTLKNSNYMWNDTKGDTLTRELTYTIKKASASISVQDGYLTQGRDYDKTVYTIQGVTPSHTETALAYSIDVSTIKNAGTYTVVISLPECANYEAAESTVTVIVMISKAKVPVPSIHGNTFTYDTNNHKPTVIDPDTELYTVSNSGNINAGSYNVELTLKNPDNYKWDVTGEESATYNIPYTIQTASIEGLTISLNKTEWTYKEAYAQITTSKTSAFGEIKVLYSANGTDWSETQPTDAGTYYVKAVVYADTNTTPNWSYAETAEKSFTIKRIVVDKPTLSVTSFTFNNGTQAPTVVDGNATNATYYTYVYSNASSKDAGSYTVTFKLNNVNGILNYEWRDGSTADFDITYTIGSYVPTVSVTIGNWEYNGSYADPTYSIVNCPDFLEGETLRVVYTQGETTLTSAPKDNGTYTVTVYLDAEDSGETPDWTAASASATFTISKVVVHKPTEAIVKPYTGSHVGCGITSDYYTVEEDTNNVNVGTYPVTFKLKDKTNYVWDDEGNTTDDYSTTYRISATANDWSTTPYVTGKTYDGNPVAYGAAAQHGGYSVTFYGKDSAGNYTVNLGNAAPSVAGSYQAVFKTTDTNHEVKTETVTFVIDKASVTAPTLSWTKPATFNGSAQAPTLENTTDSDKYTTSAIVAYTNQGSYDVTVALKDTANYKWAGTESSDALTLTYTIDPITFTLSVSVGAWTYNDVSTGKVTYTGKPGCVDGTVTVEYKPYGASDDDYSTTVPTGAGDYTVRVTVAGSSAGNWAEQSKTVNFSIDKLGIALPTLSANEFTYSYGVVQKPTVSGADDTTLYETPVFSNENSTNAATYYVTFGLVDPDNYKWIDGDSADVTVSYEIKKANAAITVQKTEVGVVYKTTAFDPLTLAEATENNTDINSLSWIIKSYTDTNGNVFTGNTVPTSVTNAGTYTVAISLAGSANYNAADDIEVTVTVDKATVERPVIADREFTNAEMTSGLSSDLYSVAEQSTGNKNVGTYYAELTLTNPANYKWAEAAVATFSLRDDQITVPYNIVTKQSSVTDLIPGTWVYGAANDATTSTPNHTFAAVEYYYSETIDGTYTTTKPTEANTYYVKAVIPADTVNNNWSRAESEPVEFTIEKADAVITITNSSQTHVYNGAEYTIGYVSANHSEKPLVFTITKYTDLSGNELTIPADNKIVNAGIYTVTVSIAESDNYKAESLTDAITVKVTKAVSSISGLADKTFTYANTNHLSTVQSGVVVKRGDTPLTGASITWYVNEIENGDIVDADTYTVKASFAGDANHEPSEATATVTVNKANTSISGLADKTFTYANTDYLSTVQKDVVVKHGETTLTGASITWNLTEIIDADTYSVTASFAGDDNHNASSATVTVKVEKITTSATISGVGDKTYDGSAVTVTVTPNHSYAACVVTYYEKLGENSYEALTGAPVNAGTYRVGVTIAGDTKNWTPLETYSDDFTISKKDVTIKHNSVDSVNNSVQISVDYDGDNHFDDIYNALALSGLVNVSGDGFLSGESAAISLTPKSGSSTEITLAGTYYLVASFEGSTNYNGCTLDVTVVVDRKPISVPTLTKSSFVFGETVSLETLFGTTTFVGYTPAIVSNTFNVGTNHKVTLTLDGNHKWDLGEGQYSTDVKTLYYNITAKGSSITVDNTEVNVDYKNDAYDPATIIGATGSYTGAEVVYTITAYTKADGTVVSDLTGITLKDAGTYVVTVKLAHNDNYSNAEPVDVTVNIAKIDDSSVEDLDTTQSATYGQTISSVLTLPTSSIGEWYWADASKHKIENPSVDTVGDAGTNTFYAVFTPYDANLNNYNSKEIEVTVTVAKAQASIVIPDSKDFDSYVYTNTDYYGDVKNGITASNGVDLDWSITSYTKIGATEVEGTTPTEIKNAGTYVISIVLPETDNHFGESETITVTVNKATASISGFAIADDDKTWSYGEYNEQTELSANTNFGIVRFVYSTTGGEYVDLTTFLISNGTNGNLNARDQAYYVKAVVDGTDNYNGAESEPLRFTIKKALVNAPDLKDITYNGSSQCAELLVPVTENTLYFEVEGKSGNANAGYSVSLTVELRDPDNYAWNSTKAYSKAGSTKLERLDVSTVIGQGTPSFATDSSTSISKDSWTFGDAEVVIITHAELAGICEDWKDENGNKITVELWYSYDGNEFFPEEELVLHTSGAFNAGKYWVKAVVKETKNYKGIEETTAIPFTVSAKEITIPSLKVPTYNGDAQNYEFVDGTNFEGFEVIIVSDGEYPTVESATNADKVIRIYVALLNDENIQNYVWSDGTTGMKKLEVTMDKANNTDTVDEEQEATYGDKLSTLTLPESTIGTWSWEDADGNAITDPDATVGNAGSNTFYAVFTSSGNYNTRKVPVTVTVAKKAVTTLPTLSANSFVYNGSTQKPTVTEADENLYSVTNNGGLNVGTHYVVLTLSDTTNYKWSDVDGAEKNLPYSITKASLGDLTVGTGAFNYGDVIRTSDFTITNANGFTGVTYKLEYMYSYKEGEETKTIYFDTLEAYCQKLGVTYLPVGTYQVRVSANDNNFESASEYATFTISQAEPNEIDESWYGSPVKDGEYYQNLLKLLENDILNSDGTVAHSGTKVYYKNNADQLIPVEVSDYDYSINGTFNGTGSKYNITVTPSNTNFKSTMFTVTVPLKTVATIGAPGSITYSYGTNAFGTIEDAVAKANSNVTDSDTSNDSANTVWVVADNTGYVQILKKDLPINPENENDEYRTLTIGEGVKLVLPYLSNGTAATNTVSTTDQSITAEFNGGSTVATDAKCSTKVILGSGVELMVAGDMIISGQLDGGGGDKPYCGQTSGNHARLILNSNSKITVFGHLRVPGFIIESSTNNGSKIVVESAGTIYQPFVLRDFKGGSITAGIYYGMENQYCTPFNQFTFMNVEPTVEIHGHMIGYVNIYAGEQHNPAAAKMIGKSSDSGTERSFIELTTDNSYLVSKYNKTTQILKLDFYGGAETQDFEFTVEFLNVEYTASSDMFVFPISWIYDITLRDGTYDMTNGNRFKLLPGANFTVEAGATLQIAHLSIYESFADEIKVRPYPSTYADIYGNVSNPPFTGALPGARFMLRGTLKVSTIGGKVYTDTPNAKVIFESLDGRSISTKITNYEPAETEDGNLYDPITRYTTFNTVLKLYYEYMDANNQTQTNVVGYIVTTSEYTSTATGYTWLSNPEVDIPTIDDCIQLTINSGDKVWTDEAVMFENGVFAGYYTYDSTINGAQTIYLLPGAQVKYSLTSGQLLVTDGSTTVTVNSPALVKTSDYTEIWEAKAGETPKVYDVPVLRLTGLFASDYSFVTGFSVTYTLNESGMGTAKLYVKSSYDISLSTLTLVRAKQFSINDTKSSGTWVGVSNGGYVYQYEKTYTSNTDINLTA